MLDRDQAAHFGAALIPLALFVLVPNPLTGACAGFIMGMIREVTEEGDLTLANVRAALGSWKDLLFWTLGGATAGLIGAIA